MIIHADYDSPEYNRKYLFTKYLPEKFYPIVLKYYYKKKFNRILDLKNPKRLSEKILWSILYDRNPMKTILSDKLKAKEYVSKLIPQLKNAEVYQMADLFEELDFKKAPETFVIKTNHAWNSHILIDDKNRITKEEYNDYKKFYEKILNINYAYWGTPELQYKNIKPQIFLEEYLHSNEEKSIIREYEIYCFNGKPEFLNYFVSFSGNPESDCSAISEKQDFLQAQCFDLSWNKSDFKIRFSNNLCAPKSINKKRILDYAEILSTGFEFVRIDFFEIDTELYFGEFTFSPYSGFIQFIPEKYDLFYGNKLKIKKLNEYL